MDWAYDLDAAIHDELFEKFATPRKHRRKRYETLGDLSAEELSSIQEHVTCPADEQYIHIRIGRDYRDVSPTRGVLHGGRETELEVEVRVRCLEGGPETSGAGEDGVGEADDGSHGASSLSVSPR